MRTWLPSCSSHSGCRGGRPKIALFHYPGLGSPIVQLKVVERGAEPSKNVCLRRSAIALLSLLGAMASAHAQIGGGHGHRQRDQQQTPQNSPALTPLPAVPEIWPRLDDGALICKSRDDLVRYQTQVANGVSAGQTSKCHTIQKHTGIQILDHDGISRTQIVTTDESKETGWTNSYLPSTPPPSIAKGPGAGK
jgi:hypothetical protein